MMMQIPLLQSPFARRLALGGALVAGLLSVAGATGAQDRDAPLPGLWQYSYRAAIYNNDETKCLSKAEVKRFFDGLCNKGSTCTYSTNDAHDGKVKLVGVWLDHKGRRTDVKADGIYDAKSFKLNAHILASALPIPIDGTIDGHFISADCPAGSDKPDSH
jgi:hypothetical protein